MVANAKFSRRYSQGRSLSRPAAFSESLRPWEKSNRYLRDETMTAAGIEVEVDDVLHVDTILACTRVLAESMACMPFELKQRDKDGSAKEALDHLVYELMRWQPNDEMSAYEFRMWLMVDAILRGTGYAQVRRDGSGKIIDLWPLFAKNVKPMRAPKADGANRPEGRLIFKYTCSPVKGSKAREVMLEADEVFRIQVLPNGGLISASLVELQREAIGAAKASETYSSEFFANGGVVSGVIEIPEEMSEPAYERFKKDWKESHSGTGKRHRVPILEGGAKFNPIALNHSETQLLETRKFQRSQLAGIFRVPAHMINDLEKATFSNVEHIDLAFVKHTLRPWMTNWEQRSRMTLLSKAERKERFFFMHDDRDLLRGDFPSRMEAYSKAVGGGIMCPNDARRMENWNTYAGGEKYFVNGTLVPIEMAGKIKPAKTKPLEE